MKRKIILHYVFYAHSPEETIVELQTSEVTAIICPWITFIQNAAGNSDPRQVYNVLVT